MQILTGESQMGPSIARFFYRFIAHFCGKCFPPHEEIVPADPISGCTVVLRGNRDTNHSWHILLVAVLGTEI